MKKRPIETTSISSRTMHHGIACALFISLLLALGACGKKHEIWNGCKVSEDQKGAFMSPLTLDDPVVVSIDKGFKAEELSAIYAAMKTWNDYGQGAISKSFFGGEVADTPSDALPTNTNMCEFDGDASDTHFHIVRVTNADSWKAMGLSSSNPGATIRCYDGDNLSKQVMVINPDIADATQMRSVTLHELGHAMGLDHSCASGSGSGQYKACSGIADTDSYHLAVMFPTLSMATGGRSTPEVKEKLNSNDKDRADCLYKEN